MNNREATSDNRWFGEIDFTFTAHSQEEAAAVYNRVATAVQSVEGVFPGSGEVSPLLAGDEYPR